MLAMPLHLVTYDITDARRLRRVSRVCEGYGQRLQMSVFLMELEPAELARLVAALARVLNHTQDRVRYTPVCLEDLHASTSLGLGGGLAQQPTNWVV
jgi:CRISPR-associated protein Cas2